MTPLESLLNEVQRGQLMHFLKARIGAIDGELNDFRRKRKIYAAQMNDNFEWRSGARSMEYFRSREYEEELGKPIFFRSNYSFNIVGGFAAFITARGVDDFFGTDPYYSVSPEGSNDNETAADIQRHSEWKMRMNPWKDAALDAIDCAVGLGEGVIKQTWRREIDEYESTANVLMDIESETAIKGPDDDYVYGPDEFGNGADDVQVATLTGTDGQQVDVMIVAKYPPNPATGDPGMVLPAGSVAFQPRVIPKVDIRYNNVQANTVHYADLIIPINEDNLEDSPFVGQRTQMRLSDLIAKYQLTEEQIAKFQTDTYMPKTVAAQQNIALHEATTSPDGTYEEYRDPLIELVECWIRHDPIGERKQRRMYVLFAPQHQEIVTMDYIGNVTPQGKLPFQVIRAFKVKNRWYGRGYFEIYEKAQEFIDYLLNCIALRNKFHSNPITFFDPSNLLEDEETKEFVLEPGRTYRLKPGLKAEDVFQILNMPDLDERTWQLMQMMIQIVQVRSGITSAAQGEVSSMPATATATGIESILQSASTLARQPMNLMKDGLERSLLYALKLIYANMDRDEVYSYFEGDQQQVGTLEKVTVKSLEMNVRLLLTRFKAREAAEAVEKAMPLIELWITIPEQEKDALRPVFVQGAKGLGFNQAETIFRQAAQMDPATGQLIMPGTGGQPGQPMLMPPAGQPGTGAPPGSPYDQTVRAPGTQPPAGAQPPTPPPPEAQAA